MRTLTQPKASTNYESPTAGATRIDESALLRSLVERELDWPCESEAVAASRAALARTGRIRKLGCIGADSAALVIATAAASWVAPRIGAARLESGSLWIAFGSIPLRVAILAQQQLYRTRHVAHHIEELRRLMRATALGALLLAVLEYASRSVLPRGYLMTILAMSLVALVAEREYVRALFRRARYEGRAMRPVILVGAGVDGTDAARAISEEPWSGTELIGYLDLAPSETLESLGVPRLGDPAEAPFIATNIAATTGVIIDTSRIEPALVNDLARRFNEHAYHVELTSSLRGFAPERLDVVPLGRFSTLRVQQPDASGWRAAAKRSFDLFVATIVLIVLSPLLLAISVSIRLADGGPVFFRQDRARRGGERFGCWKFRTMVVDAERLRSGLEGQNEQGGALFKIRQDPRVTRVGRVLRRYSLDELPQLINVVLGEMSLVGPRPLPIADVEKNWDPRMAQRLSVKPGMTGMWQVSGRSDAGDAELLKLDLHYVDNWSLFVDLLIIGKTVPAVVKKTGAY